MPDSYENVNAFFTVYPTLLRLQEYLDYFCEVAISTLEYPALMTDEQKEYQRTHRLDPADPLLAILNDDIIRRWFSEDLWLKKTHDGLNVYRTAKSDEEIVCAGGLLVEGLMELSELMQTMAEAVLGQWGWRIISVYSDSNVIQRSAIDEMKFLGKQLAGPADEKSIRDFISYVQSDAVETVHWWMDCDPANDSKYSYGPIKGNLRKLAAWTEIGQVTLKRRNGYASWYIVKEHGRSFRMWFSSQYVYMKANGLHLSEIAQNDMK